MTGTLKKTLRRALAASALALVTTAGVAAPALAHPPNPCQCAAATTTAQ